MGLGTYPLKVVTQEHPSVLNYVVCGVVRSVMSGSLQPHGL